MIGKSHEEFMIERFRAEPGYAVALLNSILEDGDDQGELSVFLRQMAAAFGVEPETAESPSDIARLVAVLHVMGCRLVAATQKTAQPRRRARLVKRPATKRPSRAQRKTAKALRKTHP